MLRHYERGMSEVLCLFFSSDLEIASLRSQ